jgi:hypothetical protein
MLFYFIIQLALILSICHSSVAYGMENITNTQLGIPLIIQEHSDYLKMLANNRQADFHKNPLKWSDDSLVTQDELNGFAETYQPNFDYNQLSLDALMDTACFHDYFQMQLPTQCLENVLYDNIKTNQLKEEEIESLASRWQRSLTSLLVKDKRLDVQLLKAYSDSIIANEKNINNRQKHSTEELLFLNDTTKIYGAYTLPWFTIVKGSPRFTVLLVKDGKNNTIQKEINVPDKYYLNNSNNITIHPNGLCAIVRYYDRERDYRPLFDIIDLTSQDTMPVWDTSQVAIKAKASHACCFGKDKVYAAACNDNEQIFLKSIALDNKQEEEITILDNPFKQEIAAIASNEDGSCIVVATQHTLFVVKNNGKDIKTIVSDKFNVGKHGIQQLSLNNNGTLLCIVTGGHPWRDYDVPAHVYLWNLAIDDDSSLIDITNQLQGNLDLHNQHDMVSSKKSCLVNVANLQWNRDDSLLFLECGYRYQCLNSSGPAGKQYAFICPSTYNCWSERNIRKNRSIVNSADNEKTIVEDSSGWLRQTKLLEWCDDNMRDALRYFNPNPNGPDDKKLSAMIILNKIIEEQSDIIQLNRRDTKIYKKNIPDAIKLMLAKLLSTKRQVLLLFEKNVSALSSIKVTLYQWSVHSKNFLRIHQKKLGCGLGIMMLAIALGKFCR